jgi:hypothetical protein
MTTRKPRSEIAQMNEVISISFVSWSVSSEFNLNVQVTLQIFFNSFISNQNYLDSVS